MTDNFLVFGRKVIQFAAATQAVSYTRLSDSSSYTPQKGDALVVFASSTKNASGNTTLTTPTGWTLVGQSPNPNNNSTVNQSSFILVRTGGADGTATDSPTITVSTTTSPVWQFVTYVLKGVRVNILPSSPASVPQTGNGSTSTTGNTGVALTTQRPDEVVMTFAGLRLPLGASALIWTNTTADLPLTQVASANNYVAVGIQRKTSPGSITPSATWTSGSGCITTINSIGFVALGDQVGAVQS